MYVLNITDLENTPLYTCDKFMSDELIKNGFCYINIKYENALSNEVEYVYVLTDKLESFLNSIFVKGGEEI